jgi:hypothetical protein
MAAACTAVCPPNTPTVFAHPPILCGCEPAPGPGPAPGTPPLPTGAVQSGADTIRITFDMPVTATPQLGPAAFTVNLVGAPGSTVVTGSVSGNQVNLVLNGAKTFTSGTVTYAPTGTGDLKAASDGTPVAGFTRPVTPVAFF